MSAPFDLYHALIGDWRIIRRFNGADAFFDGSGSFAPDGVDVLSYREAGHSTLAGTTSEAFQAHHYRFDPCALTVSFADGPRDGQVYLTLPLPARIATSDLTLSGAHHCPPDLYQVRYRFGDPAAFTVETTVTGPKKSYKAVATYRRRSGGEA